MLNLVLLAVFVASTTAYSTNWAVVVSGSSGYWNYRHQADACHSINLLKNFGIPEENIVTMIYDDVVDNKYNPYPGKLFNKPTDVGEEGLDVYADCHIDYSGLEVTPKNFMHVMLGDYKEMSKVGSGKVLGSDSDSNVFVFFVDHGATGLIAFPDAYLYEKQLMNTLKEMHKKKMYNELVFYLEACESGSMFKNLPNDINIYATTAANGKESSWAAYCPPHNAFVDGKNIQTCLGDLYSVNFLEDVESGINILDETLESDFELVKNETIQSHVLQFGDMSIALEDTKHFFAAKGYSPASDTLRGQPIASRVSSTVPSAKDSTLIDSRDVKLHFLFARYGRDDLSDEEKQEVHIELMKELQHREFVDGVFESVGRQVMGRHIIGEAHMVPESFDCLRDVNEKYIDVYCGTFSDYSLKYVKDVVRMCESWVGQGYSEVEAAELIGEEFKTHCIEAKGRVVEM